MKRASSKPVPPRPAKRKAPIAVAALALLVLSALPFLQTLKFGLVWDDPMLLTQVGRVAGSSGVKGLFESDFRVRANDVTGYYRPVTTSTLWSQSQEAWRAGGTDALPQAARALHTHNLLTHLVCSTLAWLLLRRLTANEWAAWLGAALFAVHPVHVEPVAFISARTDLLSAMFVLGSLLCWLQARRTTGKIRAAALITGALLTLGGALAKEHALLLPFVLALWSALFREKGTRWWTRNRVWLALWFLAVVLAVGLREQAGVGFNLSATVPDTGGLEWFVRLGLPALVQYVKLWFFPSPLTIYYTSHEIALGWFGVLGLVCAALLLTLAIRNRRAREAIAACGFTLIFLSPVLHLAPLQGAVAAERFFYLPSVGLALLTALALAALERERVGRTVSRAVLGVAIAGCVILSMNAAKPWASDATLFARMVETSPHSPTAHHGLAEVLSKAGKYPEAARECREAIRLNPDYADAHETLGIVSAKQGDHATARQAFQNALRLVPYRASTHSNLGVLELNDGDLDAAITHFRRAAELDPTLPRVHYDLGFALTLAGDLEGAAREVAILDRLDPNLAHRFREHMKSLENAQPMGE